MVYKISSLLLASSLLVGGCGQMSSTPSSSSAPPLSFKQSASPTSVVSNVTVALSSGWNPVAFQAQRLTGLTSNPSIVGFTRWNGTSYVPGNFTVEEINAGGGGRQGFWVFANASTSFTYSGVDDGTGNYVDLSLNGYQMVGFASNQDIPGSSLTASQGGQSVALNSVVLPQFQEIASNGQNSPVDVEAGGVLKPGRAYWVLANTSRGPVRLVLPGSPSPSPSPTPTIPANIVSLDLSPTNSTVNLFSTVQFTLQAQLRDGSLQDVTQAAQWTSADPSVAALLAPGQFKVLNPFTTNITATLGSLTAQTLLTGINRGTPGPLPSPSAPQSRLFKNFPLLVTRNNTTVAIRLDSSGTLLTPDPFATAGAMDYGIATAFSDGTFWVPLSLASQLVKIPGVTTTVATFGSSLEASAPGPDGNIYVTSFMDARVYRVTPAGAVTPFITAGLTGPVGLAFDTSGNLYVANFGGAAVKAFKPDGTPLTTWGAAGTLGGLATPTGLAFDTAGNLYISEQNNGRVLRTPANGVGTTTWVTLGGGSQANGLAFDSADNLYVADRNIGRVMKLQSGVFVGGSTEPTAGLSTFATLSRACGLTFSP